MKKLIEEIRESVNVNGFNIVENVRYLAHGIRVHIWYKFNKTK